MVSRKIVCCLCLLLGFTLSWAQNGRPPMMGWSSWNTFRVDINEELIKETADVMVSRGLKDAGYQYVNIDDGYFGGRAESGILYSHLSKFPNGMKPVADYIHSKGLKARLYSDAGSNTCGSIYEAEYAFMQEYLPDNKQTAHFVEHTGASGHYILKNLGNSSTNWAEFRNVFVSKGGKYKMKLAYFSVDKRDLWVKINDTVYELAGLCSGG